MFIAGDCNARCKDLLDYIPDDNLDHIFGNVSYDGDTFDIPRQTKDRIRYNSFGRSLVELCRLLNVHMLNGRTNGDRHGEFTCTANDGCSLVDYNIVSTELFESINTFRIEDRCESDHFPLFCNLHFHMKTDVHTYSRNDPHLHQVGAEYVNYNWSVPRSATFLTNISNIMRQERNELF